MVAELCEAHDEVDGRLLQICGDLKTRVLPSGNWLFCLAALSLVPKLQSSISIFYQIQISYK